MVLQKSPPVMWEKWGEVMFVETLSGTWKRGMPKTYALSNDETLVQWMWVPRHPFFLYQCRPALPYDEYERQMQGLLELVEAKTHLPLYDITPQRWWV